MDRLCDIPVELVKAILLEYLPQRWRFHVRLVCAQWKGIFDTDGDDDHDRPPTEWADKRLRRNDTVTPWTRLSRLHQDVCTVRYYYTLRCKWRRGSVVLASAAASWCTVRHSAERESPRALVNWCLTVAGTGIEPAMVVTALVSTNVPVLMTYAIETLLPMIELDGTVRIGSWYGNWPPPACTRWTYTWNVHHRLMYQLSRTSDLDTIRALLPRLDMIRWPSIVGIGKLLDSTHSDVARFFLEQWFTAHPNTGLGKVWSSVGLDGSYRAVANLLAIMSAPSPDLMFVGRPFGDNECDYVFGVQDDHALDIEHDTPVYEEARDRDALAKKLLASWKRKGCHVSAINAAMWGHLAVLERIEPYMTRSLKKKVFRAACRCAHVDIVDWCLRVWSTTPGLEEVTARRAAALAVCPYVDDVGRYLAENPPRLLNWIFDPKGGGYIATLDEMRALFTDRIDLACALWLVKHRTTDIVALGPQAMYAFVTHTCSGKHETYSPHRLDAAMLERLVHALDIYASVTSDMGARPFDCDLWLITLKVAREQSQWNSELKSYGLIRYVWARATNQSDAALTWLGIDETEKRASIDSWRRWCRPAPITVDQFWDRSRIECTKRSAGNMMCWLAARGLLMPGASASIDLATLRSTAPDQQGVEYETLF